MPINFALGKLLYNIFLILYSVAIRIAAMWKPKAKKWLAGRKEIFGQISRSPDYARDQPGPAALTVWMHCASLGEFEQGRPLLESLRSEYPSLRIVLTFFSPSGYDVCKDYKGADHVFYLPMDSAFNAKKFIGLVDPSLVIWVKYEYWFYYLDEIKRRNIPLILVSGIFRRSQPFFSWYGGIWKKMLGCFTHFFVQNQNSKLLLESIGIKGNITVTGDTRFDRVVEIENNFTEISSIKAFCETDPVIVAGSTWREDEVELWHYVKIHPEIKFLIAPHEVDEVHLSEIRKQFTNSVFYSELAVRSSQLASANVLIIDNIGMLSRLYKYATVTYVGGGFGADGVHNVLEAAVYGKPVVFGPEFEKYEEAKGLEESGGGISVDGPLSLEKVFDSLIGNEVERAEAGNAAREFVYNNAGASEKILRFVQENRLLTS